jgi:hypothetical protein
MTFERACYLATLCDSYSRLSKIVELVDELTEKDWLKLLGKFWTVCDNTGAYADFMLFDSPISRIKGPVLELMTEHEIKFLNDLPEQVGYVPMVRTGLVKKDDIIAYFNSRNEHEIVLRNVEIVDDEYL